MDDKIGWVNSWQICDKGDVHPSHATAVLEVEEVLARIQLLKVRLKNMQWYKYENIEKQINKVFQISQASEEEIK